MNCYFFDSVKHEDDLYITFETKSSYTSFVKKSIKLINSHIFCIHNENFDIIIDENTKTVVSKNEIIEMTKKVDFLLDKRLDLRSIFSIEKIQSVFSYSNEWNWKCYTFEDENFYYFIYWETHA